MLDRDTINRGYHTLLTRITDWSELRSDVRAALLIGSRARTDHPADEWSDLDILLFVREPQVFVNSAAWVSHFGTVLLTFVERTPDGASWERRVLYDNGLDVDFALNPAHWLQDIAARGMSPDVADLLRRGVRVLEDKDGFVAKIQQLPLTTAAPFCQPAESEFLNVVSDFWYHSVWSIKHLRRGELWWAKSGCDGRLKTLLQQMLEWHAHATKGAGYDTWLRGRFLEEWADPRAVRQLPATFAHYDADDIARALVETMNLFRRLAVETAEHWHYTYPSTADRAVTALVHQLLPR